MSVRYLNADFMSFLPDLKKLIEANYEELCVTKDFPLIPDYEVYERVAKSGNITCIVCMDDDEVVGYAIFLIQPHLHYKTCLTAFEDIYYLKPEYRKGRTGIKMFKFAEEEFFTSFIISGIAVCCRLSTIHGLKHLPQNLFNLSCFGYSSETLNDCLQDLKKLPCLIGIGFNNCTNLKEISFLQNFINQKIKLNSLIIYSLEFSFLAKVLFDHLRN